MARQIIFSDSIITDVLPNKKLKQEILKELKIQEKSNNGNILTNRGGFQSKNIFNSYVNETIGSVTINNLLKYYNFKKVKFTMVNSWINKNNKDDFNIIHSHPNSTFSGIYYVDVPDEGGELVFYRSNNFCNLLDYIDKANNDTELFTTFNVKVKNNLLILFRSYLAHFVMPHKSQRARISVAFNIKIEHG